MSFLSSLKAVCDYGVTLVLSAVVIYVILKLIQIFFKKFEDDAGKKKHDEALALRGHIDEKVYATINDFIESHHGTKIQVIEFTNSVMSVAYLPFKYMSCTYEVVAYGNTSTAHMIDKLSTSLFTPFLSKLAKSDFVAVNAENVDTELVGMARHIYTADNSNACVLSMIRSQVDADKCIGYVVLYKESDYTESDTADIQQLSSNLSALLGVMEK